VVDELRPWWLLITIVKFFTAILGIVGGGAHNFFITSLLVINALITFTHFSF
jgi:hypothetical protein